MTLQELLGKVYANDPTLAFNDVLDCIDEHFIFTPTPFVNGKLSNSAEQNQGSCKVLAFAHQAGLHPEQALLLFAEHFRAVKQNPNGDDHQNIRNFMASGWQGLSFAGKPLVKK